MFGDGKSQTGAADFAGARNVNAVEAFEDAGLIRSRDADAGVGNREGNFRPVRRSANHDLAASGSVLHGVVEQILQHFGETAAVGGNVGQLLRQVKRDAEIFFGRWALGSFDAALNELGNTEPANLQLEPIGIHFREHEQVFREARETPGVLEDDLEEVEAILRIVDGAGKKRFRKTLNRGERCPEFVGNVGNKIAAHALELAQLGDVVQHNHRAGSFRGADGCDGDRKKMLAQGAGDDFGFDAGLALQDAADRLNQLRLAHDFNQGAAGFRREVQAQ